MKRTYAFVANEKLDKSIADAVSGIFTDYGRSIPISEFRDSLRTRLKQSVDLVAIVSLETTPLADVEKKLKATAYRVIGNTIYQTEPETL